MLIPFAQFLEQYRGYLKLYFFFFFLHLKYPFYRDDARLAFYAGLEGVLNYVKQFLT